MSAAYHRATSVQHAAALLRTQGPLTILAGGTDIYPARASRLAWGHADSWAVLDISGLSDLRGIVDRGTHWWIGALTTWTDIVRAPLPPVFDALKAAAREIGGVQIQNRGTIGGNCCTASPAGDCIPCLLALDATFEVTGDETRVVAAGDFFTGYRKTALAPGEMLTGIRIPKQSGHSAFRKLGARRYLVISIAMVAAVVDADRDGCVRSAKIAVGACAATAQRLPALEAAMRGARLDVVFVEASHIAHLKPIDDIRASAEYRLHAALELTRSVIADLAKAATEVAHG
jgi:CO/xanthine dehydrogenase FAD-binding subunit